MFNINFFKIHCFIHHNSLCLEDIITWGEQFNVQFTLLVKCIMENFPESYTTRIYIPEESFGDYPDSDQLV